MDPLSQVFSLLNIRAGRCTRLEASGSWSYRFPAKSALKIGAVVRGECWLDIDGATSPKWARTAKAAAVARTLPTNK